MQPDESVLSDEPKDRDFKVPASDWSTAGDMSMATDTGLTGDLPSLARALSDRVRTLVRMHAAAGSGLSPRAKNGRRTPSPNQGQGASSEALKLTENDSAGGVHHCDKLHQDKRGMQKHAANQDISSPQDKHGFAMHGFQACDGVVERFDGANLASPRQLQTDDNDSNVTNPKTDYATETACRKEDGNACDSGSNTGCPRREASLRASAPFPGVARSEDSVAHVHAPTKVRLRSHSGSTAPPDPFSLRQGKVDHHHATSGRQHGVAAVSAVSGHSAPDTGVQQQHLQLSDERVGGGSRSDGASVVQTAPEEHVQDAERGESFYGHDQQHLKGELDSVRAMIAEMQVLRTAVAHGDLDVAMVPTPLTACVVKFLFGICCSR